MLLAGDEVEATALVLKVLAVQVVLPEVCETGFVSAGILLLLLTIGVVTAVLLSTEELTVEEETCVEV